MLVTSALAVSMAVIQLTPVSIAVRRIRKPSLVLSRPWVDVYKRQTKEGYIYLTPSGKEIADMIYERHQLLSNWLMRLGVDEKTATEDACRMEHVISKESFEAIKNHIK